MRIKIVLPVFETNADLTEDEKVIYKFLSKTMLKPISEIAPYIYRLFFLLLGVKTVMFFLCTVECYSIIKSGFCIHVKAIIKKYDLIFMDIQMPKMDGYMITREIRTLKNNKKANIPIVAMTANAFEEDRKKAFDAGMDGHIAKPIDIEKLRAAILRMGF